MSKSESTVSAAEHKIEEFAEDLGKLLGSARAKAEGWLGQRQNIARQLTGIRDTTSDLLRQLTGRESDTAPAVRRGRRGRPVVSENKPDRKRRKMSAKARAAISAAQKKRWAKLKAAEKK